MFLKVLLKEGYTQTLNIEQIVRIDGNRLIMSTGESLFIADKSLAELEEMIFPKKRSEKSNGPDKELVALFEQLHTLTGGKGRPVFSLGREKKLKDLLTKHRLTKHDLIRAARNIGQDAFLQGENENKKRYGDIDYLLRPDKAAKWAEEQEKKKKGMF